MSPLRPRARILCLVLAAAAVGCAPSRKTESEPEPRLDVRHEIEEVVASGPSGLGVTDTLGTAVAWARIAEFYHDRHYHPIWSNGQRPNRQAERLLDALGHVDEAGLDPAAYEMEHLTRLRTQAGRKSRPAERLRPRILARFDVLADLAALKVTNEIREGRVPRAALDPDWALPASDEAPLKLTQRTLNGDPRRLLADREPPQAGYRRLRQTLKLYREIAAAGGWPEIGPGPPLTLGARGRRVAALVRRLAAAEGLSGVRDTVFDRRIEQAVGDYQTRLGIPRSGILGEATRAALDLPVEFRIRQIELNLERWRWLPDTLGARHLEINIPAYRLDLVSGDSIVRSMRVVVGKRLSPTPVFSDRVTYLELNPTWTLPPSVVQKEIVPALKKHRDYLEANHMHVISIASAKRDTVDPRHVPWKDAISDSFPYLVVQDAGPDNPLGRIKLMCPNEYDVYLHDTPLRSRFSVAVRDYSHGCVRVEHAVELADSLVAWTTGDTIRIDSLVAVGTWRRLSLRHSVPVHFLYWTAWVDEKGRTCFRDDVYGLDRRLDQALRRRDAAAFELNPGVAVSPFWLAAETRARAAIARVAAARGAAGKR